MWTQNRVSSLLYITSVHTSVVTPVCTHFLNIPDIKLIYEKLYLLSY